MIVVDDIVEQARVMLRPAKSVRKRTVAGVMKYYYSVAILPLIISLALLLTVGKASVPAAMDMGLRETAIGVVLFYVVLVPLGMLFEALVLQLIGSNFLQALKGRYSDTLSALAYSKLVVVPLLWLVAACMGIPLLAVALIAVLAAWSFVVEVVGLAKLCKTSRLSAFAVVVSVGAMIAIAAYVIAMIVAYVMYPPVYYG